MAIKVTPTIRAIAFPVFEQHGFYYDEKESSRNYWTFSKQVDGIDQYILINKSNHSPNSISLFLSTSKDRAGIMGRDLAERSETWWEYENQDEFHAVIREIVEVAIKKGLPWCPQTAKMSQYGTSQPFPVSEMQVKKSRQGI